MAYVSLHGILVLNFKSKLHSILESSFVHLFQETSFDKGYRVYYAPCAIGWVADCIGRRLTSSIFQANAIFIEMLILENRIKIKLWVAMNL